MPAPNASNSSVSAALANVPAATAAQLIAHGSVATIGSIMSLSAAMMETSAARMLVMVSPSARSLDFVLFGGARRRSVRNHTNGPIVPARHAMSRHVDVMHRIANAAQGATAFPRQEPDILLRRSCRAFETSSKERRLCRGETHGYGTRNSALAARRAVADRHFARAVLASLSGAPSLDVVLPSRARVPMHARPSFFSRMTHSSNNKSPAVKPGSRRVARYVIF